MNSDMLIDKLTKYGADLPAINKRFSNNMELYYSCLEMYLEDECFVLLSEALATSDYEGAYHNAHTLKGTTANMGLIPMFNVINAMVESLRKEDIPSLKGQYNDIVTQYNIVKTLILNIKK